MERPVSPPRRGATRSLALLLAACVLLGGGSSLASDDPAVQAARAGLERVRALRSQRPNDAILVYYEALLQVRANERESAVASLQSLVGRKLGIVPVRNLGFDAVWTDAAFAAVRERLAAEEAATTPPAPVSFRLADAGLIPEGIAHDPASGRFFVGSIARGKIVAVDAAGTARDFSSAADRLDLVLGLAVDARRRSLLAVSTNGFADSAKAGRRNAVLRYDLESGKLAARHDVAEALQLNDVAVGADGTLWVTDSEAGSLYRMRPGEAGFAPVGAVRSLPGANGVAVGGDGAVYVALSTGIARVDPVGDATRRLAQPDDVVTGGIDGLYWHDGDLVGVQNSTNPGRVVRIALADAGQRIAGLAVLQSHHHPAFAEPTTGTLAGGALHVIANSHVARFRPDGSVDGAATLTPPVVVAVPLRRP